MKTEMDLQHRIEELEAAVENAYANASGQNLQILGLLEIATTLNQVVGVEDLLEALSAPVHGEGASAGSLWWISDSNEDTETMVALAAQWQRNGSCSPITSEIWQPLDGPFNRLLRDNTDDPTLLGDLKDCDTLDPPDKAWLLERGTRALALLPLAHTGKLRALLIFEWREPYTFDEYGSPYFTSLSAIATGAVMSRRLVDTMEQTILERTREIQDKLDVITQQQEAIRALSSPILEVWTNVLVVPIIGTLDEARRAHIMDSLLHAIVERQSEQVILDVTGVEFVDEGTADHLVQLTRAATLLGASCVVTGIHPAVAQTLVEIGASLNETRTLRSLEDGLRACLRAQGLTPRQKARRAQV